MCKIIIALDSNNSELYAKILICTAAPLNTHSQHKETVQNIVLTQMWVCPNRLYQRNVSKYLQNMLLYTVQPYDKALANF